MILRKLVFCDFSGIVAVADRGVGIHSSGNSANIRCCILSRRALHRAVIGAVFDGAVAEAACNAAHISVETGYRAGHRYILDHCIFYSAEQAQTDLLTNGPRGHRHIQPADGMAPSVKAAGIVQGRVFVEMIRICNGRPFFVVQINILRQHGAGGGGRYQTDGSADFFAVDRIPEQLQAVSVSDQKGRIRCAEAV